MTADQHTARGHGPGPETRTARRTANPTARRAALLALGSIGLVACSADGERSTPVATVDGKPLVVVTYSILGDIVSRLVGDAAHVEVIVPDGQDPHEFDASARDIETMMSAALVVSNGLDLEEGLEDALEQVASDGVPVFAATDHVTVRDLDDSAEDSHDEVDDAANDDTHAEDGHGGGDPHVWTSAATMAEMLPDLATALEGALGVQLDDGLAGVQAELAQLDTEVQAIVDRIPAGGCTLVTGHESLGYFADRYGCTIVGAVVPSLSSTAEASAKELAELERLATQAGVAAIFSETGTPASVAEEVADTVGVPLVELPSHDLPDEGGYAAYLTDLATRIADALA